MIDFQRGTFNASIKSNIIVPSNKFEQTPNYQYSPTFAICYNFTRFLEVRMGNEELVVSKKKIKVIT